jgi:hypothetical protein
MYADLAARSIFLTTGDDVQSVLARRLLLFSLPRCPHQLSPPLKRASRPRQHPQAPLRAAPRRRTSTMLASRRASRFSPVEATAPEWFASGNFPGSSHAEQLLLQNAAVRAVVKMGIARCVVHRFHVTRPRGSSTSPGSATGGYRRAWELLWLKKSSCCGHQGRFARSPLGRFPNDRALRDRGS